MKAILSFFTVTVILLLASCGGAEEVSSEEPKGNLDEFRSYELSLDGVKLDLFEVIESVEVMRLEETEKSLVGSVYELIETADEYIIENSINSKGNLLRYTKSGKFIEVFDRKGNGPEEYPVANVVWEEDGMLMVQSKYEKLIKQYQINGEYVKTVKLDHIANDIVRMGDGYAVDMNHEIFNDSLTYDIIKYNKDFEVEELLLPFNNTFDGFMMSSSGNGFLPYNDGFTYLRTLSDSMFMIDKKGVRPLMKFDFGDLWIWSNGNKDFYFTRPKDRDKVPKRVNNINAYTESDWVFLNLMTTHSEHFYMLLDRQSGKYIFLKFDTPEVKNYYLSILRVEKGRLLLSLSSDIINYFLSSVGEGNYSFVGDTSLEEIEASENPVILWITLKDNWTNWAD